VPAGVALVVATVIVVEDPVAIDVEPKVAEAPVGRPDAERLIVCPDPRVVAVFSVVWTEPPGVVLPDEGEGAIVKASVGGARQPGSEKEVTLVDQLNEPDVLRYSVENQNVQSSAGSVFIVA